MMTKLTPYEKVELAGHIKRKIDSLHIDGFLERVVYDDLEQKLVAEFGEQLYREQLADIHDMIDCYNCYT